MEILDSRTKANRGIVRSPMGNMTWVYCVNCGKRGGLVTEETVTMIIWQCDECYYVYGHIPGLQELWGETMDKLLGGKE